MTEDYTIEHSEIISSLHTLGLDAGATQEDIRSAFRKLARELHPDVTGQKSDFRFKQITGAYNLLKNLPPEELSALASSNPEYEQIKAERKRQEESRRAAEESSQKIDSILDKYELSLKDYYASRSGSQALDIKAAVFRLKSRNSGAIRAVLKHSAHLANKTEFRKALSEYLRRPEIDEACAEIIASLPFDDMTRKQIAIDVANNAANLPTVLTLSLIHNDQNVIESFLLHIKPEDFPAVLRRWPPSKPMNANVTRKLLESSDARVLVPVLSLMKTNFPGQAPQHKKRLAELETHPTAAVRALAKKLV